MFPKTQEVISLIDGFNPNERMGTIRVDATLTEKDGRRLWSIYSVKDVPADRVGNGYHPFRRQEPPSGEIIIESAARRSPTDAVPADLVGDRFPVPTV